MLHTEIKRNKGVLLFIMSMLVLTAGFPANIFGAQPKPRTPRDRLKSPARPRVPGYMDKSEEPALKEKGFFLPSMDENKPRIHLGALELHPYGFIEEKYDTNIFLEPRGQENADWITDYRAGFAFKLPFIPERGDDYMLEGDYHADFIEYLDHDNLSRIDHAAHGALTCAFPNDFGVRVSNDFLKTQDPPNNELTNLTKRWWDMADARLNYTREAIKFEGAYTLTIDRYDQYTNLDKNDHMYTGTAFYKIATKTWLLGEFNYGLIKYVESSTNSDSKYYQGRVGVEGKIAPKLTGTLKFGYRHQDYTLAALANTYSAFTAFANIKYEMTERTTFNIYGERRPEESSYATNSYYEINSVGVKIEHLLRQRLWLNGGFFWSLDHYPKESTEGSQTAKRKDTLPGASVGLTYEVKDWVFLSAGYEFRQRDSNFNNFDYDDHKGTVRVSIIF